MKTVSRFFSVLCYIFMAYSAFTAVIAGISLIPTSNYAVFGYLICFGTLAGFVAAIVLNIFKCKWTSLFVLTGTAALRLYTAVVFFNRSRQLLDGVFAKHHLWILAVVACALLSTICYKKYRRDNSVYFEKTKKDQERVQEKLEEQEADASTELL